MSISLVKRSYNSAKQLAEKFIKDEIKYTDKAGNGIREYSGAHPGDSVRIITYPKSISIEKCVPTGHFDVDIYKPLITRERMPNNTTETVISLESSILDSLKKVITTVRKNGKKTTKTEYQYWDNGNKRITPIELYTLIAKGKLQNAAENVKEAILEFLCL